MPLGYFSLDSRTLFSNFQNGNDEGALSQLKLEPFDRLIFLYGELKNKINTPQNNSPHSHKKCRPV